MFFYVEDKVLEIGVKVLFAVVHDIDNRGVSKEWEEYRNARIKELLEEYRGLDVHADPILEGFNILHDRSGVKRRKNTPSSENLIKQLVKHGGMPIINQVVDIYNIISLESKLSLGAHDIDRVDGNVTLRFTDGTERFQPIGQADPYYLNPGEYAYCDDSNEVLCRLEVRQVEKTKVTEDTRSILFIIQGNDEPADSLLQETAERIIQLTIRYCGGKGEAAVPQIVNTWDV